MKVIIYWLAILTVTISICSCGKKENDSGQPQPNNRKQSMADTQEKEQDPPIKVVAVPNQDKLALSNDEILQILRKAGFSESQIQECSASINDGLANSGAVRIVINDMIEAGLAVRGNDVFISTRNKGYFIYNIKTGWTNMQKY